MRPRLAGAPLSSSGRPTLFIRTKAITGRHQAHALDAFQESSTARLDQLAVLKMPRGADSGRRCVCQELSQQSGSHTDKGGLADRDKRGDSDRGTIHRWGEQMVNQGRKWPARATF